MKPLRRLRYVIVPIALAWGVATGSAIAQVEQAHLRIDGMT